MWSVDLVTALDWTVKRMSQDVSVGVVGGGGVQDCSILGSYWSSTLHCRGGTWRGVRGEGS